MKTIDKYVFKSFLSSFALAFLVLSFVLTIGLLVQIVGFILDGLPIGLVGKFAAISFPETLQWTIPLSLLVSSVLVFSRLSADSEIAAMRACGINILSVMKWPIIFALLSTFLAMWINNEIVPRGHEVRREMTSEISVGDAFELIKPGVLMTEFPDVTLFVGRKEGRWLYDITATDKTDDKITRTIRAQKALALGDGDDMALDLYGVKVEPLEANKSGIATGKYIHYPIKVKKKRYVKKIKDFCFAEIVQSIKKDSETLKSMTTSDTDKSKEHLREHISKTKVELSKRFVFAMASLCFVLVGIPLGIRSQRKESTIGMAISIAIAMCFYLIAMLMINLQKNYLIHPEILIWLSPIVCFVLAGWFVKRNL